MPDELKDQIDHATAILSKRLTEPEDERRLHLHLLEALVDTHKRIAALEQKVGG